ncbi:MULTISPECIES: CoA-binding protein [Fervidobacterium]|uniref:CoA-binding protein n=1 Tax=Fervidobacterium islandicum TaxID=2423 RepID=A0AAI8CNL7_FERIS|nr:MULTISPECIES: CoA-binding protein [Fervidobacterium]AMW33705.1 CoA-binding protein [Fervidobacterium islandicum]
MDLRKVKRVAIVGATTNPEKFGNIVLRDLKKKGFEVLPVSPRYDVVEGLRTYKSVEELPDDVDLIVFIVPPEVGIQELKKAYDKGFRKFWFQPGAESGEIIEFSKTLQDADFSFIKCIMVQTNW